MKMIIRTLCAAALVFGAASLSGCGDKAAADKAADAGAKAADKAADKAAK